MESKIDKNVIVGERCVGCKKIGWKKWKVKKILKENEKICNRIACSEECFLKWWNRKIVKLISIKIRLGD